MSNASTTPCLDAVVRAYIATALWSSTLGDDRGTPMDLDHDESDLAPATLAKMEADCAAFLEANRDTIEAAIETGEVKCGPDFDEWERAGHDFWLTRNGHGAGFWDGDWPEPMADRLAKAAHAFGEVDLYVGDDGLIYS